MGKIGGTSRPLQSEYCSKIRGTLSLGCPRYHEGLPRNPQKYKKNAELTLPQIAFRKVQPPLTP